MDRLTATLITQASEAENVSETWSIPDYGFDRVKVANDLGYRGYETASDEY
jgi:hypothetical protein